MKKIRVFNFLSILFLFSVLIFSCVPARKYKELQTNREKCDKENSDLKDENRKLSTNATEQDAKIQKLTKQITVLLNDTLILSNTIHSLKSSYDQLNQTYNLLIDKEKELMNGNTAETKKILSQLQKQQEYNQNQEDQLRELGKNLEEKQKGLEQLDKELKVSKEELKNKQSELEEKQAKLIELQQILNKKDSTVKALKDKVTDALLSYQNNGLTIQQKNGKVYVSLDEKLLFKSASYIVDTKGVEALKKLAKVLETNSDVSIMVEGHTDNVPYNGKSLIKDNWDLSVMRATSVVKIILENSSIDPKRLTAAGRSQYLPVDPENTSEARSKNRRTEIILTPKLDELFQIIESN